MLLSVILKVKELEFCMVKFKDFLESKTSDEGIELTKEQLNQLQIYFEVLMQWNEKINLTSLKDPEEIAVKHFLDSLMILKYVKFPAGSSLMDVGTGAGFPGLVLKIIRPDLKVSLLDSLGKRLKFLKEMVDILNIRDAKILHFRAEIAGKMPLYREQFDFVVARAVAPMFQLLEYCIPFVKVETGTFIAMKSKKGGEEVETSEEAAIVLGAEFKKIENFYLTGDFYRSLVFYGKNRHTPPRFPRQTGQIRKKIIGKVKANS